MVNAHTAGFDTDAAAQATETWEHKRLSLAVSVVMRERELRKPPKKHHGGKSGAPAKTPS
jgi:hypothetical protein